MAPPPFSEKQLHFLRVGERWMPSLVYDDYSQAYRSTVILKEWDFNGMKRMLNQLPCVFTERALLKVVCTTVRVAIVLGDIKTIVWEDATFELRSFGEYLPRVMTANDNPALINALKEACKFLTVLADLPNKQTSTSSIQQTPISFRETRFPNNFSLVSRSHPFIIDDHRSPLAGDLVMKDDTSTHSLLTEDSMLIDHAASDPFPHV